jgi:hypothetical protein
VLHQNCLIVRIYLLSWSADNLRNLRWKISKEIFIFRATLYAIATLLGTIEKKSLGPSV